MIINEDFTPRQQIKSALNNHYNLYKREWTPKKCECHQTFFYALFKQTREDTKNLKFKDLSGHVNENQSPLDYKSIYDLLGFEWNGIYFENMGSDFFSEGGYVFRIH